MISQATDRPPAAFPGAADAGGDWTVTGPLRLFVAIAVPALWRARIAAWQTVLNKATTQRGVRWVPPAQLHLTLWFLGDVAAEHLPALVTALAAVGREWAAPFALAAGAPGAFPSPEYPRVLWLGIEGATAALCALQARVAAVCRPWTATAERREFVPHLTLARTRPREGRWALTALRQQPLAGLAPWEVAGFDLVASVLNPGGARHSVVAHIPLQPA